MHDRATRTLVLSIDPAFPAISGGDLRNSAHIRAACRLGPVLAVSLYGGNERLSPVPAVALGGRPPSTFYSLGSAVVGRPAAELSAFSTVLRRFEPDVVLVEGVALSPFLEAVRTSGARLVVDMHNVESQLAQTIAAAEPWTRLLRRRGALAAGRTYAAAERDAVRLADAIWVCSEPDRDRLAQATGFAGARIVPNGLPDAADAGRPRARFRPRLLFAGHLGYRPNVWAARELAREVMPLLRDKYPDAALTLAGRSPSRHVLALAGPSVRILSNPPDMAALLAEADFAVIPLRQGGGTRIKILEAIAAGLVVVATALAAEGLELEPGKHLVIAETPREMADAISRLAADPEAAAAMAAEGRAQVLARYAPEIVADRVVAELRSVLPGRPE